jgi:EpsI family protein
MAAAAVATVAVAAAWPLYAMHLDRSDGSWDATRLEVPSPVQGWTLDPAPLTEWRPRYEGAAASIFQTYRKDGRAVALYLGYYPRQRAGAELVTSTNIMVVQKHPVWSNVGESNTRETIGSDTIDLRQTRLRSPQQRLLVWDWFRISGRDLTNPYVAKLYLARNKLLDQGDAAAAVIVATPYEEQDDVGAKTLALFVREMKPSIDAALRRAANDTETRPATSTRREPE